MDQRRPLGPPEFTLDIFADPNCVKDIVRGTRLVYHIFLLHRWVQGPGILHTIFFHRYFPSLRPSTIEVLDVTLPFVTDPQLETLIDTRVGQLIRQLSSNTSSKSSVRGQLAVQFFEKIKRKGGGLGWFTGAGKAEEEVCWEVWCLEVTIATPRTEAGMFHGLATDK